MTQNAKLHPVMLVSLEFSLVLLPFCTMWWLALRSTQGDVHSLILGGGIAFIALFCGVVASAIHRVRKALAVAVGIAKRIAAGELTANFDIDGGGQLGELMSAMQGMHDHTLKALGDVRTRVTTVVSASSQISRDNVSLQARTDNQVSALQQTSDAMENLNMTVQQNAEHARQADQLVASASQQAHAGGDAMGQVVSTMGSIKESSRQIVDIIGLIDSIAFQTNILALNAAVEAARAGEHGRGFAIVASEVRTLAQRSASAAKEIRALIHKSVETVNASSNIVDGAGKTISEIVASVESLSEIVKNMGAVSNEQLGGIASVNAKIVEVTRKNDSTTRLFTEVIDASNSLNEQAVALLKSLSGFNVGVRENGTPEEAHAMVEKAVSFLQQYGRDSFLAEVNKLSEGQFIERDLYVMALNVDTYKFVAHALNPRVIGSDIRNSKNMDGKYYMRELVDVAKQQGQGWCEYRWNHPVTNEVLVKATYVQRVGDLAIACGAYKE